MRVHSPAHVDYERRMAIVAVNRDNRLIAVARHDGNERSDEAEVAIVVQDAWQGKGLGTILMSELLSYGESKGIYRFRAYTLADNHRMLDLFGRITQVVERHIDHGIVSLLLARTPKIEIGAA
jgi:GNAT superfamily N-acetyltransferase